MYCSSSDNGKIMGTGSADKLSDFFIEVDKLRINGEEFEFDFTWKYFIAPSVQNSDRSEVFGVNSFQ